MTRSQPIIFIKKLRIKDENPVFIKNYKIPQSQKTEMERQVIDLLKKDIIEPSNSEYNSPVLLVPKKSLPGSEKKAFRMVIDFRKVNEKIISDRYPLPRIDEILDGLGRAKYFSCLDLYSGFHQIELEENSRDITSFSTDNATYRFKRVPFGLKVAPNSFQRMMSLAFAGLTPEKAFIYMDDLVIFGATKDQMLKNIRRVFDVCRDKCLKLNPEKCVFFKHEVIYLGHRCTENGILPDDSKYERIRNYPKPTDAESVRRFVQFINYFRRFIRNFNDHSYHLTRLTRKNIPFIWTNDCQKAFDYFKNCLLKPQILKYPDFDNEFCITTDASKIACRAVLSQEYNGMQMPIAYASRTFTKGEQNKSVIEQELLAIHWALNHFKNYIYGRKFLVRSDHKPLVYLFAMKNPSSKLTRVRLDLEEFDFRIEHIKGSDNVGADALSRIEFDDIKQIAKINAIQTRSMTNREIKTNNNKSTKIASPDLDEQLIIYETINGNEVKHLPKLSFRIKRNKLECIVEGQSNILLKFASTESLVKDKLNVASILSELESRADNSSIEQIKLSLNDEIFKYISTNEFKRVATNELKKLKIALTPRLIEVHDHTEKSSILQKFHDDSLYGGHAGIKRMLAIK